jgi:NAD+ diphosphatase
MLTHNDYALCFHGDKLLTGKKGNEFLIPFHELHMGPALNLGEQDYFFLGKFEEKNIFAISISYTALNKKTNLISVKDGLKIADNKISQLICQGKQLLHWHATSLYSGCCGSLTKLSQTETAKICQKCSKVIYPVTFPVIIVLIEREGRILLARSSQFPQGMYSLLAGFVNPGESCEAAIHREVTEEVGIQIKELAYFGSQPWPFPSSLMLGYQAKYAGGEICIDKKELEDARWFDPSDLPLLPSKMGIARKMIDAFFKMK